MARISKTDEKLERNIFDLQEEIKRLKKTVKKYNKNLDEAIDKKEEELYTKLVNDTNDDIFKKQIEIKKLQRKIKDKEKSLKENEKKPLSENDIINYLFETYGTKEGTDVSSQIRFNITYDREEFNGEWISKGVFAVLKNDAERYFNPKRITDKLFKSCLNTFAHKFEFEEIKSENQNWRNKLKGSYTKNGEFVISDMPINYKYIIENTFDGEFSFNDFYNEICYDGQMINDVIQNKIIYNIGNEYDGKLHNSQFRIAALYELANEHLYRPFIPKLEALVWDGEERIKDAIIKWFKPLSQYTEIYQQWTKKFFAAIIYRIYEPGCTFQSMPIIITEGGTGKDLFIASIMKFFYDGLNKYYAEASFKGVDDKDTIQLLQQNIVINFGEMKNFCSKDNESIKAFMTRQEDSARFSYRKDVETYPRHCVFYGSTNSRILFNDYTSPHDRRYWPIESTLHEGENAEYIDIFMDENQQRYKHTKEEYEERDYYIEQLWAEAVYLYKTRFNISINDIDLNIYKEIQDRYKTTCVEVNYENIHIALNHLYKFDSKDNQGNWTYFANKNNWIKQLDYTDDCADLCGDSDIEHINYINILPLNWLKQAFNLHSNDNNYYLNLLNNEWNIVSRNYSSNKNQSKILVRNEPKMYSNTSILPF